jgi:hypothetical protein
MQASSSRQLKEVGRVIVARPVFCALPHTKRLTSITRLPIYIKGIMAIVVGVTHIAQNQNFFEKFSKYY